NEFFKNSWDFNQLLTTQRRNMEAFATANQTVVESAQAISRRQAEVARDSVEHVLQASKEMMNGSSPESSMAKHADFTRDMFENSLSHMREMVEMATKCSFEAFDVLNKRAAESLEEFSKASTSKK
ncbi:MAG: phasin family protein, partial [Alphaproteobacteria bacterium]